MAGSINMIATPISPSFSIIISISTPLNDFCVVKDRGL